MLCCCRWRRSSACGSRGSRGRHCGDWDVRWVKIFCIRFVKLIWSILSKVVKSHWLYETNEVLEGACCRTCGRWERWRRLWECPRVLKPLSFGVTATACFTQVGRFNTLSEEMRSGKRWRLPWGCLRMPKPLSFGVTATACFTQVGSLAFYLKSRMNFKSFCQMLDCGEIWDTKHIWYRIYSKSVVAMYSLNKSRHVRSREKAKKNWEDWQI